MKLNLLKINIFFIISLTVLFQTFLPTRLFAEEYRIKSDGALEKVVDEEPWTGIDVSIVGKYAEKYGRPPRDPYINTDQGDLLLFVFTIAGVAGGFVMGFNARKLFYEK